MPSDKPKDFETLQRELCASFDAVAEAMRNCAQIASTFSKYVSRLPVNSFEEAAPSVGPENVVVDKKKRKRREKKDPNEPKRPTSAYLLFQNEVRKYYQDKFPGRSYTEVLNEISKSWKELPDEKKDIYKKRVEAERVLYAERMRDYKNQLATPVDTNGPSKKKDPVPSHENGASTRTPSAVEDEDLDGTVKESEDDSEDGTEGSEEEEEEVVRPPIKKQKSSKLSK